MRVSQQDLMALYICMCIRVILAYLGAGPLSPPLSMRRRGSGHLLLEELRPPRTGTGGLVVGSLLGVELGPLDAKGRLVEEAGDLIPLPKARAAFIRRQHVPSVGLLRGEDEVALGRRAVRRTAGEDRLGTESGDGLPRPFVVGTGDRDDLHILGRIGRVGEDFREGAEAGRARRSDLERPAGRKVHGNRPRTRIRTGERLDHIGGNRCGRRKENDKR